MQAPVGSQWNGLGPDHRARVDRAVDVGEAVVGLLDAVETNLGVELRSVDGEQHDVAAAAVHAVGDRLQLMVQRAVDEPLFVE